MNVLVILCDTLRRDHCGPYHHGRRLSDCTGDRQPDWVVPTPNLDRLAARGTVFENAWCGSSPCMPARRDIYTGQLEFLRRGWGPLEDDDLDLPRQISGPPNQSLDGRERHISQLVTDHFHLWEQGSGNYHMGFSGFEFVRGMEADAYITAPIPFSLPSERYRTQKFERHYRNAEFSRRKTDGTLDESQWTVALTFDRAASWIEANHSRPDFFLHIDSFSPHEPWEPPERLVKQFDPGGYDVPEYFPSLPYMPTAETGLTEDQIRHSQALYAASVVHTDECLGRVFDALDRHELWDNTLVILVTDHGTYNGGRGLVGKLQTHQFDAVAHIPFIVAHPQFGHGERRTQLVQLVDIYPTALAALGIDPVADRHGVNLLPVLEDAAQPTRDYALAGVFGHSVTLTDGQWTLHQQPVPSNQPLYWYSHRLPQFLPYNVGPYSEQQRRPVQHTPFPGETWLSNRCQDPNELTNLIAEFPQEARRLQEALRSCLQKYNAPLEQFTRLGLEEIR